MVTAELDEILDRYGRDRTQIISILQDVQERERYLPEEALTYVAQALEMPRSQIRRPVYPGDGQLSGCLRLGTHYGCG